MISKEQLRDLVVAADDEALGEGTAPNQRGLRVVSKVMKKLSHVGYVLFGAGAHPMVAQILSVHSSLYRPKDLGMGGVHGGIFMFRDVFARIYIPFGYGRMTIEPFKLTDLTPNQIGWLATRPDDLQSFIDQFSDIMDFAGGIGNLGDYKLPPKAALELFWLAAFQLQAAAAALSVAFDFRGAIQSALIGAELSIKGGLVANGATEGEYKAHGHNLGSATLHFAEKNTGFDLDRALRVIGKLPPYVKNRYSASQPGRIETGHIAMGCQFIAGEVMRQVTGYTVRHAMSDAKPRIYPA